MEHICLFREKNMKRVDFFAEIVYTETKRFAEEGKTMFELRKIGEHTYYIESPTRIGIYCLNETDVCLIDGGLDAGVGKKVRRVLDENGWHATAIFATHAHADHVGAMGYLQEYYGCPVYAPSLEYPMLARTALTPTYLFGGFPFGDLRGKFFQAPPMRPSLLTEDVLPVGFEMIPLPGHTFDMVGFKTPDDIWFLGDCVCSETTLEKYHLTLLYDVESYLKTLDALDELSGVLFVPSHAEPVSDLHCLTAKNRAKICEISDLIVSLCGNGLTWESLLKQIFDHYGLQMDLTQYTIVGSTVRCYLAYLYNCGKVTCSVEENCLIWRKGNE